MDKKKLKILRDIGYTFPMTCGACAHFRPGNKSSVRRCATGTPLWGTCVIHTYKHEKHTGAEREVSVHALGSCGDFQPLPALEEWLGAFKEFLP